MAEAKQRHLSSVRRLAAIMFTDIVGYTKMMSKDEQDTLSILRTNRETHRKFILDFSGQFLKEMGDGILASFENSSDAVVCAAAIQKASKENKIELRIGIHMGEVTFENKDVFGDGVNIASRIQPLAEPNQILISETVHHNVQNKPGITSRLLGERELKNVIGTKAIYIVEVEDNYLTPRERIAEKKSLSPLIMAFIAILMLSVGLGSYWLGLNSRDLPREDPVIRYNIDLDARLWRTGSHSVVFSPDGKYLCYISQGYLFLKSMEDPGKGLPVSGVRDPRGPFFSPDGNWIGYDDPGNKQLMKIHVTGGNAIQICHLESWASGRNWYEEGIFFGMNNGIYRANPNGGIPEKIYPFDQQSLSSEIANPQLLPDKKTVLFNQYSEESQLWNLKILKLESDKEPEILLEGIRDGRYIKSGYIAFLKDQTLQVVAFDPDAKKISGEPVTLTSDRIMRNEENGQFSFNHHGTLVYSNSAGIVRDINTARNLVWIDLSGKTELITKEPGLLMSPKISSDGRLITVDMIHKDGSYEIALYDPVLGTATDFITMQSAITPVWSPDNTTITYYQMDEPKGVYTKPIDLSYPPKLLFESDEIIHVGNWSKDGRYLLFRSPAGIGYYDITNESVKFLDFINEGEDIEVFYPTLSPDGKWLAYTSDDDRNQDHLFVVPFPGPGRAHRISVDEGFSSVWAPDMKSIYFISHDSIGFNVSKANIETNPQFSSTKPEVLFYGNYSARYTFGNSQTLQFGNTGIFDIHPDGDRFLMEKYVGNDDIQEAIQPQLKVIVNWPGLLGDQ